ncbi:crotonase/enoyl-CoA hydratase family protein [Bradyrhizobium sp. LHD-71]|uniref:crotonase/enoyl-CoA hydratase family protein n=1 Tax=Bradyrhizobium sp. LHD-71 TaxID=3072141 RepID=UPI00280F31B5|nr:crotonase/enoyl-CoA hydratase family protein [Bradyrhizobium sp. LHD-71]MDQ8731984.1 crotonase/enoyl-CoA hydratase family protein [Bradyrhizobium sp. LHD-71]
MSHVLVRDEGAVRVITMNRPEKKNALTQEMYHSIAGALDSATGDKAIRCIVIAGQPGAFTAGNDLADFMAAGSSGERQEFGTSGGATLLHALLRNPKPLVAAVDGVAVGIGTTMMFHCDYVVATKASMFATPFVGLGLVPEGASSLLMPRALGHQKAFEILVMGRRIDGEAAHHAGFVNQVAAPGQAEADALTVAQEIAALPPEAVAISKRLMRLPPEQVAERFALEGKHFGEQMRSPEALSAFKGFLDRKRA